MEPVLLGLLCADKVITEEGTRKKSIIGTFNSFWAQRFPAHFGLWFVYLAFTNVSGEHHVTLNITNPSNDFNVYSATATFEAEKLTTQIELSIPVVNYTFPEEGSYEVAVSVDGKSLGSRRLNVSQIQSGGGTE